MKGGRKEILGADGCASLVILANETPARLMENPFKSSFVSIVDMTWKLTVELLRFSPEDFQ